MNISAVKGVQENTETVLQLQQIYIYIKCSMIEYERKTLSGHKERR